MRINKWLELKRTKVLCVGLAVLCGLEQAAWAGNPFDLKLVGKVSSAGGKVFQAVSHVRQTPEAFRWAFKDHLYTPGLSQLSALRGSAFHGSSFSELSGALHHRGGIVLGAIANRGGVVGGALTDWGHDAGTGIRQYVWTRGLQQTPGAIAHRSSVIGGAMADRSLKIGNVGHWPASVQYGVASFAAGPLGIAAVAGARHRGAISSGLQTAASFNLPNVSIPGGGRVGMISVNPAALSMAGGYLLSHGGGKAQQIWRSVRNSEVKTDIVIGATVVILAGLGISLCATGAGCVVAPAALMALTATGLTGYYGFDKLHEQTGNGAFRVLSRASGTAALLPALPMIGASGLSAAALIPGIPMSGRRPHLGGAGSLLGGLSGALHHRGGIVLGAIANRGGVVGGALNDWGHDAGTGIRQYVWTRGLQQTPGAIAHRSSVIGGALNGWGHDASTGTRQYMWTRGLERTPAAMAWFKGQLGDRVWRNGLNHAINVRHWDARTQAIVSSTLLLTPAAPLGLAGLTALAASRPGDVAHGLNVIRKSQVTRNVALGAAMAGLTATGIASCPATAGAGCAVAAGVIGGTGIAGYFSLDKAYKVTGNRGYLIGRDIALLLPGASLGPGAFAKNAPLAARVLAGGEHFVGDVTGVNGALDVVKTVRTLPELASEGRLAIQEKGLVQAAWQGATSIVHGGQVGQTAGLELSPPGGSYLLQMGSRAARGSNDVVDLVGLSGPVRLARSVREFPTAVRNLPTTIRDAVTSLRPAAKTLASVGVVSGSFRESSFSGLSSALHHRGGVILGAIAHRSSVIGGAMADRSLKIGNVGHWPASVQYGVASFAAGPLGIAAVAGARHPGMFLTGTRGIGTASTSSARWIKAHPYETGMIGAGVAVTGLCVASAGAGCAMAVWSLGMFGVLPYAGYASAKYEKPIHSWLGWLPSVDFFAPPGKMTGPRSHQTGSRSQSMIPNAGSFSWGPNVPPGGFLPPAAGVTISHRAGVINETLEPRAGVR